MSTSKLKQEIRQDQRKCICVLLSEQGPNLVVWMQGNLALILSLLCEYFLPINLLETDTETTAAKGLGSWDESIWTADLGKPPGTWAVFPHLTSICSQSLCRYHWRQWINCYLVSLDQGISHKCYLSVSCNNPLERNFIFNKTDE